MRELGPLEAANKINSTYEPPGRLSGLEGALIDPGKPWQNGTTESFNGKFQDECLAMEWFRNRLEARVVIEDWRQHDNRSARIPAWATKPRKRSTRRQ